MLFIVSRSRTALGRARGTPKRVDTPHRSSYACGRNGYVDDTPPEPRASAVEAGGRGDDSRSQSRVPMCPPPTLSAALLFHPFRHLSLSLFSIVRSTS
ncbi:hypothetical protein BHM03_00006560 [Ensete ventricosum]|nr:hypothetical protein BHM03_00006560 [Ensete ventricosum]